MKPLILALDPGIMTGYAFFSNGILTGSGNLLYEDFDQSVLVDFQKLGDSLDVFIETVPTPTLSRLNSDIRQAVSRLTEMFPTATYIRPGLWKVNRAALARPFPTESFPSPTPHQKDAFYIGVFAQIFLGH